MVNTARDRLGLVERDDLASLIWATGFFLAYGILDRLTTAAAALDSAAVGGPSLLADAAAANPVPWLVLTAVAAIGLWSSPRRLMRSWTELDRGPALRLLAGPLVVLLAWEGAFYPYNYLIGSAHWPDRLLILVLAAGALWRPLLLVPFGLQSRVVGAQFALPSGTLAAQNIDELLIIVLLAIAGAHLLTAVVGRNDTAPLVLVMAAAIGTHFFVPGRGKLAVDWLSNENLANLALSGYNVGWLGQSGGSFAGFLAGISLHIGWFVLIVVLGFELISAVAVSHHRLLVWWLPAAVVFHIVNFLFIGYWFIGWIALELGLVLLLTRAGTSVWLARNLSLGRVAMTATSVVIAGPLLFHPPGLAWLDSPVSYGWEFEGLGRSGTSYHVPIRALAPFEQEVVFGDLGLGATRPLTGPYGVVESVGSLDRLEGLTVTEAMNREQSTDEEDENAAERSAALLAEFVRWTDRRAAGEGLPAPVAALAPPSKFWTGRSQPTFRFQEPLDRLDVIRIIGVRVDSGIERRPVLVLVLTADGDGTVTVQHTHAELP